jgi:hypothetical protein
MKKIPSTMLLSELIRVPVKKITRLNQCGTISFVFPPEFTKKKGLENDELDRGRRN